VLALLALFTHNHIFWIAALLIALVKFPNFSAPLASMAQSLERLASHAPPQGTVVSTPAEEAAPTKAGRAGKAPIEQTKREPAVPETVA